MNEEKMNRYRIFVYKEGCENHPYSMKMLAKSKDAALKKCWKELPDDTYVFHRDGVPCIVECAEETVPAENEWETLAEYRSLLDSIRILETNFPAYSEDGIVHERKTHYLLTNTPERFPVPEEGDQLSCREIWDFIEMSRDVLRIAENALGKGSGDVK